jgi:hypothetical protein
MSKSDWIQNFEIRRRRYSHSPGVGRNAADPGFATPTRVFDPGGIAECASPARPRSTRDFNGPEFTRLGESSDGWKIRVCR